MKVVVLAGGVGGARLLDGLAAVMAPGELTGVVNTGDDFEHWGLWIAPDLDTCTYTLGGLAHEERGWGLYDESFRAFERMRELGGEAWFQLGDRDLATHLRRTERLRAGARLTEVTAELCSAAGVRHPLLPMADAPRATVIDTADGRTLGFQHWLVRERAPAVAAVRFQGADEPTPEVRAAIAGADVVILAPSNPYVSIDPILALRGVRDAVAGKPVVAVSPIVAGRAVKGPLAEMIPALAGVRASAAAIANHYAGLVDVMVVERGDAVDGARAVETAIVMRDRADRARLAREVLAAAEGAL